MYSEDQLLPISALQHFVFCPRQCALIHVEQLWAENQFTVEGQHLHQKADTPKHESRDNVHVVRALPLRSLQHGLIGKADVVEFTHSPSSITPVEYKRGRPKKDESDRVQLCAQAFCLEEMCGTEVAEGALFYGKRKRRTPVAFDNSLRTRTLDVVAQTRAMIEQQRTPPAVHEAKCGSCSLLHLCLPAATEASRNVSRFLTRQLNAVMKNAEPQTDVLLESDGIEMD
ncbi:MAG: CRISPR-associated protein Cas4 [Planctomycetota bacterium]